MPAIAVSTPDFNDFMYLLNRIDVVYVGEGGAMHMACALNKKGLALFGETSIVHWHPLALNKFISLSVETEGVAQNVNNISNDRIVTGLIEILTLE